MLKSTNSLQFKSVSMKLTILLVITCILLTDAKKKKPKGKQVATCKKTDVEKLLGKLSGLQGEAQACCTKNEENVQRIQNDVAEIKNNVGEVQNDVGEVQSDVVEIKNNVEEVQSEVGDVQGDVTEMRNSIGEVQSEVGEVQSDVTEMKNTIGEVQNDVGEVQNDVTEIKNNNGEVQNDITEMKNNIGDVQNSVEEVRSDVESMRSDIISLISEQAGKCPCDQCPNDVYPNDCSDDPDYTGVKTIQPKGHSPFRVYCSRGCVYLARRFDGSVDFYRGWAEYQRGFGGPEGEHFIGLDNLVAVLMQRRFKLRVELTMWPPTNATGYAEYSNFNIADKRDKYRLTFGGYSGTAGDSLSGHNGAPFTTRDQDNDSNGGGNCAVSYTGAWWYTACHASNLFGTYAKGPVCPSYAKCLAWRLWPEKIADPNNYHYSFKKADMLICPLVLE